MADGSRKYHQKGSMFTILGWNFQSRVIRKILERMLVDLGKLRFIPLQNYVPKQLSVDNKLTTPEAFPTWILVLLTSGLSNMCIGNKVSEKIQRRGASQN